jgi:hypothetical protein
MREREFEFGPISKGVYIALFSILPVVPAIYPDAFFYYVLFLLCIGLGTRIFLERTGLYRLWCSFEGGLRDKWDKKFLEKRGIEIDRKLRDEKYRKSRYRDPKLPKKW